MTKSYMYTQHVCVDRYQKGTDSELTTLSGDGEGGVMQAVDKGICVYA